MLVFVGRMLNGAINSDMGRLGVAAADIHALRLA